MPTLNCSSGSRMFSSLFWACFCFVDWRDNSRCRCSHGPAGRYSARVSITWPQVRAPERFVLRRTGGYPLTHRRLGGGRIDDGADLGDPVRGKTTLPGVFTNQFFVGRDINAINAIVHDVAFDPLYLWSEVAQHSAGFLRNGLELFAG